MLTVNRIKTDG